jgi:CDP-glucose 4,6-dehydratase
MDYPLGQRLRELPGPLLLTGHTGFKGSWMTFLLEHLKVPVVGYSLPAEKDSLFERAERIGAIPEEFSDIRDYEALEQFIDLHKPSTIIHMAAQPLVLKSYESPRETFDVNVMGSVNVLDIAFKKDFVKAIVVVTTDKVYRNDNSGRAFIESDPLEGKDPYSASKVGTEAAIAAWQQVARVSRGPRVISVRAGNVIGGGDFAENRIIPDLIRGAVSGSPVEIRNPESTRPWQHVLEPTIGYLLTLEHLLQFELPASLNFGPSESARKVKVIEIVEMFREKWKGLASQNLEISIIQNLLDVEAKFLELNSQRASTVLNWESTIDSNQALNLTVDWYLQAEIFKQDVYELCLSNIKWYLDFLKERNKFD